MVSHGTKRSSQGDDDCSFRHHGRESIIPRFFHGGFISVALLLQSALMWQVASLARSNAMHVRPMIAMFALAALAGGIIAWHFILPVPALFSGVLLIVLLAA
jgi:hypothetical protein